MSAVELPLAHQAAVAVRRLVSLPGAATTMLAAALTKALPEGQILGPPVRPSEARLSAAVDDPASGVFVLIEHPAALVAQAIAGGEDAVAALADWCAEARVLLRWLRGLPARCLCADVGEVLAAPRSFIEALGVVGTEFATADLPAMPAAPDALVALLALKAIEADAPAVRLFAELQAFCMVLPSGTAAAAVADWPAAARRLSELAAEAVAAQDALSRLRATLQQSHGDQARTQAELSQARVELAKSRDDLSRALDEVAQTHTDLSKARGALAERDTMLSQARADLSETRTGLEQVLAQAQHGQAEQARTAAELAQARAELTQARAELAHSLAELRQAQTLLPQAHAERTRAEAEVVELRQQAERSSAEQARALDALRRDSQLLALQVEQAQEELDQMYRRQDAEPGSPVEADGLSILDSATQAPHRHLHVNLLKVRAAGRRWDSLEVRIVEHHGRPGLAFFGLGQTPEPICAWQASGQEQVREFMLFVPSDDSGRRQLSMLGTTDWLMVLGTAGVLVRLLERHGGELAAEWGHIARRLQADLLGLEPRLRYDDCAARPDTTDPTAWQIEFQSVLFGARMIGPLRLCWQAPRGEVQWLAPDDGPIALAGWPGDATGAPVARFVIPVGPGGDTPARREWWAAQPPVNRALLRAVLEALPEAMRRESRAAPLLATAQTLAALSLSSPGRAGWRAALGRLRGRRSTPVRTD